MTREILNELLQNRQEEYQRTRDRTAQIDLKVAKELLKDDVTIRIAHVIPCDPRTVQRAIKRLIAFSKERPIEDVDLRLVKPYIDESVDLFPSGNISLLGYRVIHELIALHQLGHNKIAGKKLGDYHPKLRYVQNREKIIEEMRSYELILPKEDYKHIPVFKSVEFANRHLTFELTNEASPYLSL